MKRVSSIATLLFPIAILALIGLIIWQKWDERREKMAASSDDDGPAFVAANGNTGIAGGLVKPATA